jgi:hypothetical protein
MNSDSDLYGDDIHLWSERQGALLRRLAAGEAVSDQVDCPTAMRWRPRIGASTGSPACRPAAS